MPLSLPDGSISFLDANVLVYHFIETPEISLECRNYLQRVVSGEIAAVSMAGVIADAVHKVMAEEARLFHSLESGAVRFLQRHPHEIQRLNAFVEAAHQIEKLPLRLLSVDSIVLREAAELAQVNGLLINDALIVALMQRHGISHLVTNDDDFDRIVDIKVWKPRP